MLFPLFLQLLASSFCHTYRRSYNGANVGLGKMPRVAAGASVDSEPRHSIHEGPLHIYFLFIYILSMYVYPVIYYKLDIPLLYTSIYATKMYVYTLKRLEGKAAKS